jgi:hypothetical protein
MRRAILAVFVVNTLGLPQALLGGCAATIWGPILATVSHDGGTGTTNMSATADPHVRRLSSLS